MKRYKISWRMALDVTTNPAEFNQLLDMMTHEGRVGDEFWIFISEPTSSGYEPMEEIARKCELYKAPAGAARERGIRVGEEAANILIGLVEGALPAGHVEKRIVRTRLIIRGTTR